MNSVYTVNRLLGDYFCNVLIERSIDLNLEEKKLLFDTFAKVVVLTNKTQSPHKTSL